MNAVSEMPVVCGPTERTTKSLVQTRVNVKELRNLWESRGNGEPPFKVGAEHSVRPTYKPRDFKPKAKANRIKSIKVLEEKDLLDTKETSEDNAASSVDRTTKEKGEKSTSATFEDNFQYTPKEISDRIIDEQTGPVAEVADIKISSSLQRFRSKKALVNKRNSTAAEELEIRDFVISKPGVNHNKGPIKRSKSANERSSTEGIHKKDNAKNMNNELQPLRQSTKKKLSLDELIESNHKPISFHRRSSQRRFELQKALSYGRMQDLSNTFHSKDIEDLKKSLHRAQEKMKRATKTGNQDSWSVTELAKELSDIFVNTLFIDEDGAGGPAAPEVTVEHMRDLLLELSVDEMAEIVKHFELCESTNTPVRWDLVQSIVYPHLDDDDDDYQNMGGSSSSYIMSDDGEGYEPVNLDDASQATGFSIEAYTASCNSSITGFWSLCTDGDDGSFAMDDEDMEEVEEEVIEIVYE